MLADLELCSTRVRPFTVSSSTCEAPGNVQLKRQCLLRIRHHSLRADWIAKHLNTKSIRDLKDGYAMPRKKMNATDTSPIDFVLLWE